MPHGLPEQVDEVYLEPVGGVAGDMLLAALLDVGADIDAVRDALGSAGAPGLTLQTERVTVHDESALHVVSIVQKGKPAHRHLDDIEALLERMRLSAWARATSMQVFSVLADAEATVHGTSRAEVHLHEVGQLDSVLDIVGIVVALESLGRPRVTCAAVPSGRGQVQTSHGALDCPVPAVRALARRCDIPLVAVDVAHETVTPTGMAALVVLARFAAMRPSDNIVRTGVGAGTRRFPDRPNVLRAYRVRTAETQRA